MERIEDVLLADVEEFTKKWGISEYKFTQLSKIDLHTFRRLREGKRVWSSTINQIYQFMDEYEE